MKHKDNLSGGLSGKCSVRNHTCISAWHTFHTFDKKKKKSGEKSKRRHTHHWRTKRIPIQEHKALASPHRPDTNCSAVALMHCGRCFYKDKQHLYTTQSHTCLKTTPKTAAPFKNELCKVLTYSLLLIKHFPSPLWTSLTSVKLLWINDCVFLRLNSHAIETIVKYSVSLTWTHWHILNSYITATKYITILVIFAIFLIQ